MVYRVVEYGNLVYKYWFNRVYARFVADSLRFIQKYEAGGAKKIPCAQPHIYSDTIPDMRMGNKVLRMICLRHRLIVWGLGGALSCIGVSTWAQATFTNVAQQKGINFTYGLAAPTGGVSFCDFDGDGMDDITLASGKGKSMAFYRNNVNGFTLVNPPLVANTNEIKQVLWIDYDNDGDKDLFLASLDSRNFLYRNNGSLIFEDVTQAAGLPMIADPNYGAAWGDIDRDGFLDLLVTAKKINLDNIVTSNRLYRNRGNGTFDDITISSGLFDNTKAPFCASFVDFDNDLWPDIYVAQDKRTINSLYVNQRNGKLKDLSAPTNSDLNMFGMSVAYADIDHNGTFEMYVTNTVGNKLLINHQLQFTEEGHRRGVDFIGGTGWGASFLDADNDRDQDLYVSGSHVGSKEVSSAYYMNDGLGFFSQPAAGFAGDTVSSYSNAVGDFNDDGYPDIMVNNAEPFAAQLWQNSGGAGRWLKIKLKGVLSNRDGTGSRIDLYANGKKRSHFTQNAVSYLGQNSDWVMFGLGSLTKADSIYVYWPSGHVDRLYQVTSNQKLIVEELAHSPLVPALNFSGLQNRCAGDSIVLSARLYGPQHSYAWSSGQTTPEIVVKTSGSFSVQINSPFLPGSPWISPTVDVAIGAGQMPDLQATVTNPTCFGDSNGSIFVSVSGGTAPYTTVWKSGQSGLSRSSLIPGFYQLTVTDDLACQVVKGFVIKEPEPLILFHNIVELSFGKFAILLQRFGGIGPFSYAWSVAGAPDRSSLTNLDPGSYGVTVSDVNGCSVAENFVIADIITATKEKDNIVVYPNPVSQFLTIRFDESQCYTLLIISMDGKTTAQQLCATDPGREARIGISTFSPGLYYLQLSSGREIKYRGKILIQ